VNRSVREVIRRVGVEKNCRRAGRGVSLRAKKKNFFGAQGGDGPQVSVEPCRVLKTMTETLEWRHGRASKPTRAAARRAVETAVGGDVSDRTGRSRDWKKSGQLTEQIRVGHEPAR